MVSLPMLVTMGLALFIAKSSTTLAQIRTDRFYSYVLKGEYNDRFI